MTKETGAVRLNVDPQLPLESTNILIVGAGLIGGSYAQGLSRLGYRVRAINRSQESIDFGLQQGFFAEGDCSLRPEWLAETNLLIIGLYPKAMLDWLRANQQHLRPGTLITDVSGVKSNIVDVAQSFLRPPATQWPVRKAAAFTMRIIGFLPTPTSSLRPLSAIRRRALRPCGGWRSFCNSKPFGSWIFMRMTI